MPALHVVHFETILGNIVAIADKQGLYLLAFADCKEIKKKLNSTANKANKLLLQQVMH